MFNKRNYVYIKKSNVNKLLEVLKYMEKLLNRFKNLSRNRSRLYDGKVAAK